MEKDYKKLYEDSLARMQRAFNSNRCTIGFMNEIFPETKESEDEKVRKFLVKWINEIMPVKPYDNDGFDKETVLAWLEKRGEKQHQKVIDDAYLKGYLDAKKELEKQGEPIDNIVKRATTEKQRVLLTETNGDAKIDWDTRSLQDVKLLLEYGLDYIKKLEKQGSQILANSTKTCKDEQRPDDKVESKFKVGDWIITNKNHIWYVDETPETTSYLYRLINQYGKVEVAEFEIVDKKARLLTIQDAKEGDVLDVNGAPFIYKKHDKDCVYFCCGVNLAGEFIEADGIATWSSNNKVYPATKEQRDLLFQKMHEAGYEWDAEKKELKKIEQKPGYCHHEVDLSDCSEDYTKGYYDGWNNCNQQHSQLKAEQKLDWSKEDERVCLL